MYCKNIIGGFWVIKKVQNHNLSLLFATDPPVVGHVALICTDIFASIFHSFPTNALAVALSQA